MKNGREERLTATTTLMINRLMDYLAPELPTIEQALNLQAQAIIKAVTMELNKLEDELRAVNNVGS